MSIDWSEDIIIVELEQEPVLVDELKTVKEMVRDNMGDVDVVVDFSGVDIVTSTSLHHLLKIRRKLTDCGHQLVFCSVADATKGIFKSTGLDGCFEFVDDKDAAIVSLESLQHEAEVIDKDVASNNTKPPHDEIEIDWHTCHHCNIDVIPMSNGQCPNCKQDLGGDIK